MARPDRDEFGNVLNRQGDVVPSTPMSPEAKLAQYTDIVTKTGNVVSPNITIETFGGKRVKTAEELEAERLAALQKLKDDKDNRDAFAIIKGVFLQYGLGVLGATIETLMREGYGPEEATLALKTDPKYNSAYIKRFKGNETRRTAGLNVLSEAEYLTLEDDYTKTLKAYGLESYFGVDTATKQSAMADVIGKDISAVEFTDRVSTAVDRVFKADQSTKNAFSQFYGIGEADLVKYFLDPVKSLVDLKEKATSAEIGGAALGQGLTSSLTSAQDLARFGINREQAQIGYGQIGEELPTAGSLSRIYGESGITYNQADAEAATFKDFLFSCSLCVINLCFAINTT